MTSRYQIKLDTTHLNQFLDQGVRAREAIVRVMVGFKAGGPYFGAVNFGVILFAMDEPHLPHDSGVIQQIKEAVTALIEPDDGGDTT